MPETGLLKFVYEVILFAEGVFAFLLYCFYTEYFARRNGFNAAVDTFPDCPDGLLLLLLFSTSSFTGSCVEGDTTFRFLTYGQSHSLKHLMLV